ncbi:transporter substrate-binding domain-containing protein [Reinekea marinisedimentorum]|nr:transporter substrate-binding domain-containing protein [Reinekea marinisedimentorum]
MYKLLLHTLIIWLLVSLHALHAAELKLTDQEKQFLAEHPVITLGSDSNWMPFVVTNTDGSVSGYDVEILQQVNTLTGANFQLQTGTWQNVLRQAMNFDIDGLSSSAVHDSRRQYFNFSEPYITRYQHLIVSGKNPKNLKSAENLQGIRIGYQAGDLATQKTIESLAGTVAVPFSSSPALTHALLNEQVDALIGSHSALLAANRISESGLILLDTVPGSRLDLVFSIRNDFPEALSIMNKGLAAIPDEVKQQIYNKWFYYSAILPPTRNGITLSQEQQQWLVNNPQLKVMTYPNLPPFSFISEERPTGFFIDYMRMIAGKLGIEVEFIVPENWSQAFDMLDNGELDILPQVAEHQDRKPLLNYSATNIINFKSGFAVQKTENSIHSMTSLADKVLAVTEGSTLQGIITDEYPNQKLYLASSTPDALRAVVSGEADAVFGILPVLEYHIQRSWLSNLKTVESGDEMATRSSQLKMAVKEGNATLLSILEQAQNAVTNGEQSELKSHWMNVRPGLNQLALTREEQDYLTEKRRISMCIDPDWMPFEKNENGKHIGMSADYFKLFENRLNIPIEMVPADNWLESLELGKSRQCDIFSMVMSTPEREEYLLFTDPYLTVPLVIATDISETFIDDITQITDKKIGTVKGYAYTSLLKDRYPNIQLIEVNNETEGLEKLYAGELFGFIGTLPTLGYQIQQGFIGELKITGKFDENWSLGVGVRNDEPLLHSIFNKAIAGMSTEEHQEILNKWISVRYHQEPDYKRVIYISLIFALIILVFGYHNRSIRKVNKKLEKANIDIAEQQSMVNQYVLILETNSSGIISFANEAFCRTTGYTMEELINLPHSEIIHHDASDKVIENVQRAENRHDHWAGEAYTHSKALKKIHFNTYINAIYKDGVKVGYRTILEDITDKKQIEELSVKDHLTGLYNRKKLEEITAEQVSTFERYNVSFSIALLDIDNFKTINDTYGHDTGDRVLEKLATILKQNSRSTDYVGRWGGEEFLIICPHSAGEQTLAMAENLREFVDQMNFETVGHISFSAGITEFTMGDTFASAFKRADTALYQAKTTGKNKAILS